MPYFYRDSDVVVSVPSSDSSPRSVYEAMACGIPVIISDLEWYRNKFTAEKEVAVVPVGNIELLANKIITILKNNYLDTEAAYQYVFENINMIKHSQKLENLYKELLKNK